MIGSTLYILRIFIHFVKYIIFSNKLCSAHYTSCETNLPGDTMRDPQSDTPLPLPEYSDDTIDRDDGYFETSKFLKI